MPSIKAELLKYLENHREDIRYAKKGYIDVVAKGFEEETGIKVSHSNCTAIVAYFRVIKNCPIEYLPNKYYKPANTTQRCSNYIKV